VWDVSGPSGGGSLRLTWGWFGLGGEDETHEEPDTPGATSVEALKSDLKRVAVAYQNAIVKIFNIESGKELSRLDSDISYGYYFLFFFENPFIIFTQTAHPLRKSIVLYLIPQCRFSLLPTKTNISEFSILLQVCFFFSEQLTFTDDLLIRSMYALYVSPPGWSHIVVYRRRWFLACLWQS
jgi:hypothetical protein